MGVLTGIRVVDITNVLAGPFCAYQLVLSGAEVIKVEVPGTGDLARQLGAGDPGWEADVILNPGGRTGLPTDGCIVNHHCFQA